MQPISLTTIHYLKDYPPPLLLYIYSTYQYSGIWTKISDLSHFFNNTCNCVNPGKDLHNRWGTIFTKGMKVSQHEEREQSQKHNIGKLKVEKVEKNDIWICCEKKTNQSTVRTAKRLAALFWYLIASTIDTLHAMKWHVYGTRSTM